MPEAVTTWYLEMHAPAQLRPARLPQPLPLIARVERPLPAFSRHLYCAVGGDWHWRDRLTWNYQRWLAYLDRPQVQTWVLYVEGAPAGYIELEKQTQDDVEIAYFGLIPEFTGRGLGGHLLSVGIDRAWVMGARRVWVHTCTLDGPQALSNYQARGMTRYREEQKFQQVVRPAEGPWPGAYAQESAGA